jgi:hypothetical protein
MKKQYSTPMLSNACVAVLCPVAYSLKEGFADENEPILTRKRELRGVPEDDSFDDIEFYLEEIESEQNGWKDGLW